MSALMQLLIGREMARRSGVEGNASQIRIGALAAVVPNPMLGLIVAKMASEREAPLARANPIENEKPNDKTGEAKPPAESPAPPPSSGQTKAKA